MSHGRLIIGIVAAIFFATGAASQTIQDDVGKPSQVLPTPLLNVGFEPQLNAQVPLDLTFRDEAGRQVRLREYFDNKPVLLAFVYYSCPMLCDQVQMGVAGTLRMLSFHPGRDYQVVFVSFDVRDTAEAAAQKKKMILSHYGHPESADGWHFLTGSQDSIDALTKAVNFRYAMDPQTKVFAHASGIVLLTPDGRISRYFYGVEYPGRDVRLGLVDASAGKIGSPVDHLLLYCFQYNPSTARYSATILKIVRLGGLLTIFIIVGGIFFFHRRDLKVRMNDRPRRSVSQQGAR